VSQQGPYCEKAAQFRRKNEVRILATVFPWHFSLKAGFWQQKIGRASC